MKKIVPLLFLTLSSLLYSQEEYWYMENSLVPYMKEYIENSESRGYLKKSDLISKIDYILYTDLGTKDGYNILGAAGKNSRGVYISSSLKENYILIRLVLYHELGHLLKNSGYHSCNECYDIMSAGAPIDLEPFSDEKFWNKKVDEYFLWLEKD